jgi:anti-sigma regulatory factor (Ser/Thr protein kinase)
MKHERSYPHRPDSVAAARRFTVSLVRDLPSDVVESVELMVSELATNCIRHTDSGFSLSVARCEAEIRVAVRDEGDGTPLMGTPGPMDISGRGLRIVDLLSGEWGIEPSRDRGKTVWFVLAIPVGATPSSHTEVASS